MIISTNKSQIPLISINLFHFFKYIRSKEIGIFIKPLYDTNKGYIIILTIIKAGDFMKENIINKGNFKIIGTIAIPIIMESFLHMTIGWIDTIMISRKLGGISFAGANTSNSLIGIITLVLMVLATGSGILIAQYIGAKNNFKGSQVAEQSLIFMVLLSLLLAIPLLTFGKDLLRLFPIENHNIITEANTYLSYIIWFLPIQASLMLLSGVIKSTGDTKSPMLAMVLVNLLNTFLNYVFLYKLSFGIEGPAIASGISRSFGLLLLILIINKRNFQLAIRLKNLFIIKLKVLFEITKVGLPAAIESLSYRGSMFFLQLIIMSLGTTTQIAAGFAAQVEQISFVPVFGLSMAVSIIVGKKIGAQDQRTAKNISKFTTIISTMFMALAGLSFLLFAKTLLSLFTTDTQTLSQGTKILYMLALAQPAKAINMSLNGTFRGAGNTLWVMWVTILGNWIFCIAMGYFLSVWLQLGIYGLWTAIIFDEWIRAIANIIYYKKDNWVKSVVIKKVA